MFELNPFGESAVFDHVGIAVDSIKKAVSSNLEIMPEEAQKVSVAFIDMNGIKVELIEPLGEDSPISSSLKRGQHLVHLCFKVKDMGQTLEKARANGFHCIAKPVLGKVFKRSKIAWFFSRTYGLIELVEVAKDNCDKIGKEL